jgi:hypothetical protein
MLSPPNRLGARAKAGVTNIFPSVAEAGSLASEASRIGLGRPIPAAARARACALFGPTKSART